MYCIQYTVRLGLLGPSSPNAGTGATSTGHGGRLTISGTRRAIVVQLEAHPRKFSTPSRVLAPAAKAEACLEQSRCPFGSKYIAKQSQRQSRFCCISKAAATRLDHALPLW